MAAKMRGRRESPFIGKTEPANGPDGPILYPRYNSLADILLPGSKQPPLPQPVAPPTTTAAAAVQPKSKAKAKGAAAATTPAAAASAPATAATAGTAAAADGEPAIPRIPKRSKEGKAERMREKKRLKREAQAAANGTMAVAIGAVAAAGQEEGQAAAAAAPPKEKKKISGPANTDEVIGLREKLGYDVNMPTSAVVRQGFSFGFALQADENGKEQQHGTGGGGGGELASKEEIKEEDPQQQQEPQVTGVAAPPQQQQQVAVAMEEDVSAGSSDEDDSDDEDEDSGDDEVEAAAPQQLPMPAAGTADGSDEDDESDDSEDDSESDSSSSDDDEAPNPAAAAAPQAAQAPVATEVQPPASAPAPAPAAAAAVVAGNGAARQEPLPVGEDGFVPRRVYVGGLPYSYEEEALRELWGECGEVESVDMMRFPDSGKFRGIAFITFATEEGYEAALKYDGDDLEGHTLVVRKCNPPKGGRQQQQQQQGGGGSGRVPGGSPAPKTPGYNVAYVGNIAFDVSADALQTVFSGCNVEKVRLHTDRETGKSKGFAHVHFEDEAGLDRAIALNGTEVMGRCIRVGYAQPKKT